MRLVVDTNILVSALITGAALPAQLVGLWRGGYFTVVTAPDQIEELKRVTRYPKIRERLNPGLAGRSINDLRVQTMLVSELPRMTASSDPDDNRLLAIAVVGCADFLITGDKRDLLGLVRHAGTKILTVRGFLELHRNLR